MKHPAVLCLLLLAAPCVAAAQNNSVDMNDSIRSHTDNALAHAHDIDGITPPKSANDHTMKDYPEISRVNGEQGVVTVKFSVNTDGSVSDVEVLRSSGYPRLDQAAVDQVTANWRYVPAMKDGKPVAVKLAANVVWRLDTDEHDPVQHFEMKPADFPTGAYAKGETGTTSLFVVFDATGKVIDANAARSSGYPDLDEAAQKIVRNWKVTAPVLNGKPILFAVPMMIHWPAKK